MAPTGGTGGLAPVRAGISTLRELNREIAYSSLRESEEVQREPRGVLKNIREKGIFCGYNWGYSQSGSLISPLISTDVAAWGATISDFPVPSRTMSLSPMPYKPMV
jgi:hypothetical protein